MKDNTVRTLIAKRCHIKRDKGGKTVCHSHRLQWDGVFLMLRSLVLQKKGEYKVNNIFCEQYFYQLNKHTNCCYAVCRTAYLLAKGSATVFYMERKEREQSSLSSKFSMCDIVFFIPLNILQTKLRQ